MDLPAVHFFLPFVAEISGLHVLSGSYNTSDWVLMVSLLFSRWWHESSSVWSLPGPQIQAGFLCGHTSHLPKLVLATAIGSMHRELATGWGPKEV